VTGDKVLHVVEQGNTSAFQTSTISGLRIMYCTRNVVMLD